MKKLDFGQTITILANLGVIAGIVLLTYEIRQNTSAVRSQAAQGLQDQLGAIYTMISTDPMTEIFLEGMANPQQLDAVETAKLNAYLSLLVTTFENIYAQVREGAFDDARARGYWQLMRNLLEYPAMKRHWDERRYIFSEDYRAFVETEIMAIEPIAGTMILEAND